MDSRAQVRVVDYNSLDSLVAGLKGQDALVNTLGIGAIPREIHLRLVDAAQSAGVKRYLPSEFGSDTTHNARLPVFADKFAVIEKLQQISKTDGEFTWTAVISGPFFDWGLQTKFLINLKGPSTPIYDRGDAIVSGTTLAGVGRAVVGVLKNPEETKNRPVFVAETEFTQNQLLKLSGNESKIQREEIKIADLEQQGYDALKESPPNGQTFAFNLILTAIYGGKYGAHFTKTDNELLGIRKLSDAEVAEVVKKYA